MFDDLIATLSTRISPPLRSLGYLDETLDMRRRARRNLPAWQPHLDRARKFILTCAKRCRKRDLVVVLGSGLLLDVPLAELADMFHRVVLKDVVCLPDVRRTIGRFGNASFVEHDVTGLAGRLGRGISHLPAVLQPGGHDTADLVVSLNILSQLWVVPRAFTGQHLRQLEPAQVDEWCAQIVRAHYAWLRSLSCDVCLVADHEAVKRDSAGSIVSRSSTVFGLELPPTDETWNWNIAPISRENPRTSKELAVGAWFFSSRGT